MPHGSDELFPVVIFTQETLLTTGLWSRNKCRSDKKILGHFETPEWYPVQVANGTGEAMDVYLEYRVSFIVVYHPHWMPLLYYDLRRSFKIPYLEMLERTDFDTSRTTIKEYDTTYRAHEWSVPLKGVDGYHFGRLECHNLSWSFKSFLERDPL